MVMPDHSACQARALGFNTIAEAAQTGVSRLIGRKLSRKNGIYWALGLMSGTSMDGVDAALIRTDGVEAAEFGLARSYPYGSSFRSRLRGVLGQSGPVDEVEQNLTRRHADAVLELLRDAHLTAGDIDVIGFHGHTVLHEPDKGRTRQIGDAALLAEATGIDVVHDFRSADVEEGGEGAPLAPLFHAALAARLEKPLAVLNLGGVGNVTWIGKGEDEILAFDTGPANALLNDWMERQGKEPLDRDGAAARRGKVRVQALDRLLANDYFDRPPPKSLDRDHFSLDPVSDLSLEDGAATLTAFTAASVALSRRHMPQPPRCWLVTGGGRHNPAMMGFLQAQLEVPVSPVEAVGWDGDALEAQAFGFLAVRSLKGLPLSLPTTTGCRRAVTGGRFRAA